ncbi:uncharacterized protein LOC110366644 isoform X1 [Fundulus heteroclitus]|uniref:uncharacterized protein LOC110366644 isoform X1 n=1 Tax=Fundulus heteroclitus TaxID=8078 RepID=UPI00165B1C20|nr:uncharacterized protein LOC110366644 isoform X1 [Fundulus heteroclitus]
MITWHTWQEAGMLANSSSSNDSQPGPPLSPISYSQCLMTTPSSFIYTTFISINVLLFLPLFIFILYYGFKQWWKNPSKSIRISNSDCFTYHMVIMELIGVTGCIISFGGIYGGELKAVKVGTTLFSFNWYGEGFFQNLMCVEHFVAVVHPLTYLTLKDKRMVRIRNITICFVWLLCFAGMGLAIKDNYIIMDSVIIILSIIVTPYCCLSVLWVLNHPGPGEQGTCQQRVDPLKQRAFYTVVAILGVLILRLIWSVIWIVNLVRASTNCIVMTCEVLCNLPSTLVLPLLFLQRTEKLACWRNDIYSD